MRCDLSFFPPLPSPSRIIHKSSRRDRNAKTTCRNHKSFDILGGPSLFRNTWLTECRTSVMKRIHHSEKWKIRIIRGRLIYTFQKMCKSVFKGRVLSIIKLILYCVFFSITKRSCVSRSKLPNIKQLRQVLCIGIKLFASFRVRERFDCRVSRNKNLREYITFNLRADNVTKEFLRAINRETSSLGLVVVSRTSRHLTLYDLRYKQISSTMYTSFIYFYRKLVTICKLV